MNYKRIEMTAKYYSPTPLFPARPPFDSWLSDYFLKFKKCLCPGLRDCLSFEATSPWWF